MAVSIKNQETERLARELAKRTGVSITEAITTALREQLAREEGKRNAHRMRDELLAIGRRCAARHHGFKLHHGRFLGKPRPFKSRHFGHFGQGSVVLKLSDGDSVLRFGYMPHFKHRHFGHRHHHPGLWLCL
jgi:antitoxin VapB